MSGHEIKLTGPDFKTGVKFSELTENQPLLGHFDGEPVILVRKGDQVFATGAICTHYSGPLAEGIVVDETVRCPLHHARFDLRTGEAVGAPALDPISCFDVLRSGDAITLGAKKPSDFRVPCKLNPESVVIVGAGAAGAACADMLRKKGYTGPITLAGDEEPGPVDRPNLSKDYLAGTAQEDWIALRPREYYQSINVDLITSDPAVRISPATRHVELRSGRSFSYGALLLATGAEPRSLPIEGANLPHVCKLRTLADSNAILARAQQAKHCVIIGGGFIGLEAAASLRHREIAVSVIAQEAILFAKILGPELGTRIQHLHEQNGVRFLLNSAPRAIRPDRIELTDGRSVEADLVILGVGVSPRTKLAEEAGIKTDNGVIVDQTLQTSAPDIFAAGDIARYPDPVSGEPARIEHWVVAERQGQSAARSMLGIGTAFRDTPFFWSQHYDVTIAYVGHAVHWDACELKGDLSKNDACAIYRSKGRVVAVATIGRDVVSLRVEAALEQNDAQLLDSILREQ